MREKICKLKLNGKLQVTLVADQLLLLCTKLFQNVLRVLLSYEVIFERSVHL